MKNDEIMRFGGTVQASHKNRESDHNENVTKRGSEFDSVTTCHPNFTRFSVFKRRLTEAESLNWVSSLKKLILLYRRHFNAGNLWIAICC